jgi:hypothetical protein
MDVVLCATERCYGAAVRAARSSALCRSCYVAALASDGSALSTSLAAVPLLHAEVVGPTPITDAITTCGVGLGGTVTIDPLETNVAALVHGGHVQVVAEAPVGA